LDGEQNGQHLHDVSNTTDRDEQRKATRKEARDFETGRKKKPYACQSCGGPYPLCRDGCPIFDN
jgi:radical SAM protein with 4Fe4S-binding SPASM domain